MPSGWYSLAIACATFGSYEINKVTSRKDFLCLGEHEFLSSGWYSCNSYAISKDNTPQGFVLFAFYVSDQTIYRLFFIKQLFYGY